MKAELQRWERRKSLSIWKETSAQVVEKKHADPFSKHQQKSIQTQQVGIKASLLIRLAQY